MIRKILLLLTIVWGCLVQNAIAEYRGQHDWGEMMIDLHRTLNGTLDAKIPCSVNSDNLFGQKYNLPTEDEATDILRNINRDINIDNAMNTNCNKTSAMMSKDPSLGTHDSTAFRNRCICTNFNKGSRNKYCPNPLYLNSLYSDNRSCWKDLSSELSNYAREVNLKSELFFYDQQNTSSSMINKTRVLRHFLRTS